MASSASPTSDKDKLQSRLLERRRLRSLTSQLIRYTGESAMKKLRKGGIRMRHTNPLLIEVAKLADYPDGPRSQSHNWERAKRKAEGRGWRGIRSTSSTTPAPARSYPWLDSIRMNSSDTTSCGERDNTIRSAEGNILREISPKITSRIASKDSHDIRADMMELDIMETDIMASFSSLSRKGDGDSSQNNPDQLNVGASLASSHYSRAGASTGRLKRIARVRPKARLYGGDMEVIDLDSD